jgi:hypothetical protein
MTVRDGTPLPWGGSAEHRQNGYLAMSDNPLDQLCDALRIRRPRGVERIRAMDAFGQLMRQWNGVWSNQPTPNSNLTDLAGAMQPDDPGIDRTIPPGTVFGG